MTTTIPIETECSRYHRQIMVERGTLASAVALDVAKAACEAHGMAIPPQYDLAITGGDRPVPKGACVVVYWATSSARPGVLCVRAYIRRP